MALGATWRHLQARCLQLHKNMGEVCVPGWQLCREGLINLQSFVALRQKELCQGKSLLNAPRITIFAFALEMYRSSFSLRGSYCFQSVFSYNCLASLFLLIESVFQEQYNYACEEYAYHIGSFSCAQATRPFKLL